MLGSAFYDQGCPLEGFAPEQRCLFQSKGTFLFVGTVGNVEILIVCVRDKNVEGQTCSAANQ